MASRGRPRGSMAKEDLADEVTLWNSVVDKIKRCAAVRARYDEVAEKITHIEAAMPDNDPKASIPKLDELERSHREGLKLAEEELKILLEEPDDLIKNVETLISVRAAFETEAPAAPTTGDRRAAAAAAATSANPASKPRNLKRRLGEDGGEPSPAPPDVPARKGGSRSGSVAAGAAPTAAVKAENNGGGGGGGGGTSEVSGDKTARIKVGGEVFYKNKTKSAEGEGILCHVVSVLGEGKHRRYEIQDNDPEDDAEMSTYKATGQLLVPIPLPETDLPDIAKGRQVIALYPGTTTFYKAEMVGVRKEKCRLRFEGEEEQGKEQDVDRRYVLDAKI